MNDNTITEGGDHAEADLEPVPVCASCWLARGRAKALLEGRLSLKRQPEPCALCARPTMAGLRDAYSKAQLERAVLARHAQAVTDSAVAIALGVDPELAPPALLAAYIRACEAVGVDPREPVRAFLAAADAQADEEHEQRDGAPRCSHRAGVMEGAQCCLAAGHDGPHRFKCCSPSCEGLTFAPSERPHPCA